MMDHNQQPSGRLARFFRWARHTERGQALVEFTFILPMFMLLLFAIIDFGRAFYAWNIVTNGAREGARAAAVQGSTNDVLTAIANATTGLDQTKVHPSTNCVGCARGQTVTVTVSYDYAFVTPLSPLLTLIGGSSLSTPTISSTAKMRLE